MPGATTATTTKRAKIKKWSTIFYSNFVSTRAEGRELGAAAAALVAVEYTGSWRLETCATADDIEGYIN